MRTMQRDITGNPTRLVEVPGGYACQLQDVVGWITVASGPYPDVASANRRLVDLGFEAAPASVAKLGFGAAVGGV